MSYRQFLIPTCLAVAATGVLVASFAIADAAKDSAPAGQSEIKLPAGWTMDDMKTCMAAGMPGEMHKHLAKDAGEWTGKSTMWMGPDGEAVASEITMSAEPIMDGRYVKAEMKGDMPGMGPYHGGGVYGYDNVQKKFVSSWIDNHSTGIMQGEGTLSEDGKTITWEYKAFCPLTKKQATMKEIETRTGENSKKYEMWGDDPKSGKNYKMMSIELTRK